MKSVFTKATLIAFDTIKITSILTMACVVGGATGNYILYPLTNLLVNAML